MTGDFDKIVRAMVRRRYHFFLFFASMVVIPMALAYVLPSLYKAKAVIYLRPGDYKKPFMPSEANYKMSYIEVTMEDVASEVELIQSRPLMEQVVEETGLDRKEIPTPDQGLKYRVYVIKKGVTDFLIGLGLIPRLTDREDAIATLTEKIDVDFVKRSNIITLEYMTSDPDLAMRVVNSLADNYVKYHLKVHSHPEALATIGKKVERTREQLDSMENTLDLFKRKHNVTDITVERSSLIEKLTDMQTKVSTLESVPAEDLESGNWSDIEGDPGFLELRRRLTDLQIERIELITKFGKNDQNVQGVERAISDVSALMKNRLRVVLKSWKQVIAGTKLRLEQLDAVQSEVVRLDREIQGTAGLFQLHREKLYELQIAHEMESAHVASPRVVQRATRPGGPFFPKKHILLVVCIFLGLVGGASYSYAYDRLSNRITSPGDVQHAAHLPVRAHIARFNLFQRRSKNKMLEVASWNLLPLEKWLTKSPEKPGRCILLLPAGREPGASFVAALLSGFVARRQSASVLCVSFHFRRSVVQFRSRPSLADVCANRQDLSTLIAQDQSADYDRLDIELQPGEAVLPKQEIDELLESLKTQYDFVIIDVQSARTGPFYFTFTPHADLLFLVVGYDRTNAANLSALAESLRSNGREPEGVILNGYCPESLPLIRGGGGWTRADV